MTTAPYAPRPFAELPDTRRPGRDVRVTRNPDGSVRLTVRTTSKNAAVDVDADALLAALTR